MFPHRQGGRRGRRSRCRSPCHVRCWAFPGQAYYQRLACPVAQRDWNDAHLVNATIDLHTQDPGLGYRLIANALPEMRITAGQNRVHRLCKLQRICSFHSVKSGAWKKPSPAVHGDLVARKFHATGGTEFTSDDSPVMTGKRSAQARSFRVGLAHPLRPTRSSWRTLLLFDVLTDDRDRSASAGSCEVARRPQVAFHAVPVYPTSVLIS